MVAKEGVEGVTRTKLMHNGKIVGYQVVAHGSVYEWRCRGWLTKTDQPCNVHPHAHLDHYESYISRDGVKISYSEPHDSGQYVWGERGVRGGGAHRRPDGTDLAPNDDFLDVIRALHGEGGTVYDEETRCAGCGKSALLPMLDSEHHSGWFSLPVGWWIIIGYDGHATVCSEACAVRVQGLDIGK